MVLCLTKRDSWPNIYLMIMTFPFNYTRRYEIFFCSSKSRVMISLKYARKGYTCIHLTHEEANLTARVKRRKSFVLYSNNKNDFLGGGVENGSKLWTRDSRNKRQILHRYGGRRHIRIFKDKYLVTSPFFCLSFDFF